MLWSVLIGWVAMKHVQCVNKYIQYTLYGHGTHKSISMRVDIYHGQYVL